MRSLQSVAPSAIETIKRHAAKDYSLNRMSIKDLNRLNSLLREISLIVRISQDEVQSISSDTNSDTEEIDDNEEIEEVKSKTEVFLDSTTENEVKQEDENDQKKLIPGKKKSDHIPNFSTNFPKPARRPLTKKFPILS